MMEISFLKCFALKPPLSTCCYTLSPITSHPNFSFMPFLFLCVHTQVDFSPKSAQTETTPPWSHNPATPPSSQPSTHKSRLSSQLSAGSKCQQQPHVSPWLHPLRQTPKGASSPCHTLSPALHKSGSHSTTQKLHCDTSCLQEIPSSGCQSTASSISACGTTNTRGEKRKTQLYLILCENRYFNLLKL